MLSKIIVAPSSRSDGRVDPGAIAEALLFYRDVTCVLTSAGLVELAEFFGVEPLLTLFSTTSLNVRCYTEMMGTQSEDGANRFISFEMLPDPKHEPSPEQQLENSSLDQRI